MNYLTVTAGKNDEGKRADRALRVFLPFLPLSRIYSAMRTGLIKINEKKTSPAARLTAGDRVQIAEALMQKNALPPNHSPQNALPPEYKVVFKNSHILFIHKPYDTNTHGSEKNEHSVAAVMATFAQPDERSLAFTPAPLHRLDRKTTGLLAVSQSIQGARWFSEALKTRTLEKIYLGLASGTLSHTQLWEDKISKHETEKSGKIPYFYTSAKNSEASEARTKAEPILHGFLYEKPVTLIRYTIYTGKKHQIRLQSALHGCPLAGDDAYGNNEKSLDSNFGRSFFLHAVELGFPRNNPVGLPAKIIAPPDEIFNSVCRFCLPEYANSPYNE